MAEQNFLGRGLAFPMRPDKTTGRLMESSDEEDIMQAIRLILGTRKGERVMRPEFGCRIHEYVFDVSSFDRLRQMEEAVREALILWEPRIRNIIVRAEEGRLDEGQIPFQITYQVRSTNNRYNMVYPFYIREGTGDQV